MDRIKCYLLVPTDKIDRRLRRYFHGGKYGSNSEGTCSKSGMGYHDVTVPLDIIVGDQNARHEEFPHDDPRWPRLCACGYAFKPDDAWQLFCETVWRRTDTEEEMTLRSAPAGGMYDAYWMHDHPYWCGPDGKSIHVILPPDRHVWGVDSQSSNCTRKGEKHECWCRHGEVPNLTVDKNPNTPQGTCAAGAGSIATPTWHGYLINGYLEQR